MPPKDEGARARVDALMKDAEEMPEAALEAAIPKATDALYDTREGEGNMHEAGKAAAVAALKAALPVLQAEDDEDLGQIRALVMGEEGLGDEDLGLIQKIERLVNLNRRICKADAVMLLTEKGHAGAVRFKGIKGSIPFEVEVSYGEKDDPPLTIRQVKITAGWKRPDWRKMDRSELHDATQEARDATQEEARA